MSLESGPAASAREQLAALHRQVDARFSATTAAIGAPIACRRGCAGCCQDDLTVWQVEADAIAAWVHDRGLRIGVHPAGACALLDAAGACQVHAARPYVCRSQGAVLSWAEPDGQGGVRVCRDTCPEHGLSAELDRLPVQALFELGPAEQALVTIATLELSERGARGLPQRVALRALAEALARERDRAGEGGGS